MDPDVALVDLRDAIKEAREYAEEGRIPGAMNGWREVGERFDALDEWLSKGGFPPADWTSNGVQAS